MDRQQISSQYLYFSPLTSTHGLIPTYLFQVLPDITSLIAKWQSLSKKEKMNDEEKKTPTEGSITQIDDKNEIPGT